MAQDYYTNQRKMAARDIFDYKNQWKPNAYKVDVHSDLVVKCKQWCRNNLHRWEWSCQTFTDIYTHSFLFEHDLHAKQFAHKFAAVDKLTDIEEQNMTDSNEKDTGTSDKNNLLQSISDIGQEMRKAMEELDRENDAWWNGLSQEEREDAFYAVCKRIWQADGKDRGSYRHALYSVFGFDPSMYAKGMECGYMAIHNAIFDGEQLAAMQGADRVEVIDKEGRNYVRYLEKGESVKFSLQDDNKTLKIFIDSERSKY